MARLVRCGRGRHTMSMGPTTQASLSRLVWPIAKGGLTHDTLRWLRRGVSGLVLKFDNALRSDVEGIAHVTHEIKRRANDPVVLAVQQEGGKHQTLRHPFCEWPSTGAMGLAGDLGLIREMGSVIGQELKAVGIDMNLAPVLDVDTREDNPFVGERSFGISPHICGAMGCALITAMQAEGVAACGKHFPGLGELGDDPRLVEAHLELEHSRMDKVELPPFFNAISQEVASLMVGHAWVSDPVSHDGEGAPASQSRYWIESVLRDAMSFDGPVIADDLTQPSARNGGKDLDQAAVACLAAGVDVLMIDGNEPDLVDHVIDALERAHRDGVLTQARVQEANRRVDRLCQGYVAKPLDEPRLDWIGCESHRVVMSRAWRSAQTNDTPPELPPEVSPEVPPESPSEASPDVPPIGQV